MKLRWRLAQFFEVIWWKSHLKNEDKGEYYRKKKLYWEKILSDCSGAFTIEETDSIIDMGCGPSGLYILYPWRAVTAVDPLLDKYEKTLPMFTMADYPMVNFVTSAIEDYTTTETFDYVFCMNAINHVSNIQKGFKKLAQLCNKTGKLIVTIDAHNHPWMKSIFRFGPGDVLHPHQYDMKEYCTFLENEGYKVVKTILLDKKFIFNHYMLIAERKGS